MKKKLEAIPTQEILDTLLNAKTPMMVLASDKNGNNDRTRIFHPNGLIEFSMNYCFNRLVDIDERSLYEDSIADAPDLFDESCFVDNLPFPVYEISRNKYRKQPSEKDLPFKLSAIAAMIAYDQNEHLIITEIFPV